MATQNTAYSFLGGDNTNKADAIENHRMISRYNKHDLHALQYFGETDKENVGYYYLKDEYKPSKLTAVSIKGVAKESDVDATRTHVAKGEQSYNYVTTLLEKTVVGLANQKGSVGQLGKLTEQSRELRLRMYRNISAFLVSNQGAAESPDVDTDHKAGTPISYIGDLTNATDLNQQESIMSAASTTVLTSSGGYTGGTTKTSTAIDDDTVAADRGKLTISHLLEAVERVYTNLDGQSMGGDKPSYACFVPSYLMNALINTSNTANKITSLNRFQSRANGGPVEIQASVSVINGQYGRIALFPIVEQIGEGSNNKIAIIAAAKSTNVIYNSRPQIYRLHAKHVTRELSCNAILTCMPPRRETMIAIVGLDQNRGQVGSN